MTIYIVLFILFFLSSDDTHHRHYDQDPDHEFLKKKKKKILTMTVEMIEAITKMKSHLIPLNPPLNQKLKQNLLA